MKQNMGAVDRVVRTLIAIGIGLLYFAGRISGAVAIILGIVAVAFLITSLIGRCPAYAPLGVSTCRKPRGSSGA